MIVCLDVHYDRNRAVVAGVFFVRWTDSIAVEEVIRELQGAEPYRPGELFKRELPCLLEVLRGREKDLDAVIVDGYVYLDSNRTPGLGGHLHAALGGSVPVIGVAKNPFREGVPCMEVFRGSSRRPLYVSAARMDMAVAAEHVRDMHGPFRIPTLIKRADTLARTAGR